MGVPIRDYKKTKIILMGTHASESVKGLSQVDKKTCRQPHLLC